MMFAASRSVVKVFVRGLRCRSRPGHCTALPVSCQQRVLAVGVGVSQNTLLRISFPQQSLSAGGTYSLAALHTNSGEVHWWAGQMYLLKKKNAVVLKLQPFNLPDVGEAIETVEVKEWFVFGLSHPPFQSQLPPLSG